MSFLGKLARLLSPAERRQVAWLLPLLILAALVEVAGIASVAPFLAIVADPGAIERHPVLEYLYQAGGFSEPRQFLVTLGIAMFLVIIASNAVSAASAWATLRFSWTRNHAIALRLLRGYLYKPYLFFVERHSADLGKNLLSEVNQTISGLLVPTLHLVARGIGALAVLGLLFYIDPLLALASILILGGAYGLIFLKVRRSQHHLGHRRLVANRERFEVVSEAFGGIKAIKLLGREEEVMERFSEPSLTFVETTAKNALIQQLPRYALEAIAFGGVVLMVLYLLSSHQSFQTLLPILGLYVFAGYRLMPSLQQIFSSLTSIRFNGAVLDHLLSELPEPGREHEPVADQPPLPLERSIRLSKVTFRYPTARETLFQDLDLELAAGRSMAFVGETGSGKSTLADLILGLLRPDSGVIEVDGLPLTDETLPRWQRNLGYVPQAIFLSNESVAQNIAFGLPAEKIDRAAVERAARAASIDEFIRTELPRGYDTVVGERGVRLSGGQRQRIGIARALYHDPGVLVFDEATSSLDNVTESSVLSAIAELARERTIIIIAHRLSTVRDCDRIFFLSGGRVLSSGTYEELLTSSSDFQALVMALDA